jgi:Tol biopolymer transport system component/tRNA A-37 threonylcarbamoyl transferase component Bud32
MGEVYRARDTRLERTVAIKILPQHLADAQARQRFEREAKAISNLNHPHICVLHDIGRQDGIDFLVMECVEGETLAKRLEKGALPLDQVLKYGMEIADALDKAHREGIVHRDLKPGNIMLTKSGAKLLDFGLAKAMDSASASGVTLSLTGPAASKPVTAAGTLLGTFQYMSPEQIEGKEADARSDIFAFGAVVYEMATGKRAFEGKSQASVIAAIIERDPPPISSLQSMAPPTLDHLVKRCLAKDPDERWQTARDLMYELKWIAGGGAQAGLRAENIARSKRYSRVGWILVGVLAVTVLALSIGLRQRVSPSPASVRFLVLPPENSYINAAAHAAVSPDGRQLAFVAADSTGKDVLWVRSLDSLTARSLAGTDGARLPFWSPDSRWIGFIADRFTLKKIDLTGGTPISVASISAGNGGTWNRDGVIVFGSNGTRLLYRVPAAGGEVVPLSKREEAVTGGRHGAYFLPDGNHYLYDALQAGTVRSIYVASLDSNTTKLLVQAATSPAYQQGYLLYLRGTSLIAQPFDEKRLEIIGDASALAEHVQSFSASQTGGVLAYWTGAGANPPQLVWFDRKGKRIGSLGEPVDQLNIRISPDGTKVASEISDPQVRDLNADIWLYDVLRGVKTRLTSGPGTARVPCWSPDGKHIVFSSDRKGQFDLYEKAIDGSENEELVLESETTKTCGGWSPDGKFLLYATHSGHSSAAELWTLPLFGDRKPVPYLQTGFNQTAGQFSPDGKWVAYVSNESGKNEVYVRPFPASSGKLMVSTSGGLRPKWRGDGKEIFYLGPGGELMAAKVKQNGSALAIDVASTLFQTSVEGFLHSYDASADGQRFLIVTTTPQKLPSPITVVVNWTANLNK